MQRALKYLALILMEIRSDFYAVRKWARRNCKGSNGDSIFIIWRVLEGVYFNLPINFLNIAIFVLKSPGTFPYSVSCNDTPWPAAHLYQGLFVTSNSKIGTLCLLLNHCLPKTYKSISRWELLSFFQRFVVLNPAKIASHALSVMVWIWSFFKM